MKKLLIIISIILSAYLQSFASKAGTPPVCTAQFSYAADQNNSLLIHFFDQSSGTIQNWYWDFGDGSFSIAQNASHTYSTAGTYTVILYISDSSSSCMDSTSQTIIVNASNPPCQANFSYSIDNTNNMLVHFTDSSSGNIATWSWDFGDNTTSNLQHPSHLYQSGGSYQVHLTVSDSLGSCFDSISNTVIIQNTPTTCIAGFSWQVGPANPLEISFSDTSSGNPVSWNWDFGDGQSSTLQNPVHTYPQAGLYQVRLTINTGNCADSVWQTLTLSNSNKGSLLVMAYADSIPLDSGRAYLYQYNQSTKDLTLVDSASATYNQGNYYFNFPYINTGYYRILARPDPTVFPKFYPTWAASKLKWTDAKSIGVFNHHVWTIIQLKKSNVLPSPGSSSISGNIYKKSNNNIVPAAGIELYLMLDDSNIISRTISDMQGYYEFDNLAYGRYIVHPEVAGIFTNDRIINLDYNQQNADSANFLIDGKYIITGIAKNKDPLAHLNLYPNPAHEFIYLENAAINSKIQMDIYAVNGQLILSDCFILSAGTRKKINISTLNNGLYFIRLQYKEGVRSKKFIKR
jgi:PKD repeat protein